MTPEPPPAIIICEVVADYRADADTLTCADGTRVRLAGLTALERSGACNSRPDCAMVPYKTAKSIVDRMTIGRTYRFRFYEWNGRRVVADNKDLRCAILRTGAAVTWWRFVRKYRLEGCR